MELLENLSLALVYQVPVSGTSTFYKVKTNLLNFFHLDSVDQILCVATKWTEIGEEGYKLFFMKVKQENDTTFLESLQNERIYTFFVCKNSDFTIACSRLRF
jgi:hypothetical protein